MGLWASIFFRPTMTHPDERAASMLDGHLAKDVWDPQNGTDWNAHVGKTQAGLRPMVITKNHLLNGMRPI